MDQLDEAFLRVDAAIKRLEKSAQSTPSRHAVSPGSAQGASDWDAVTRRIDAALAKARAAHAALD
jgi:hypothetical protein